MNESASAVAALAAPLAGSETLSLNISFWALQTLAMMITALLIPRLRITSLFGALGTVVALSFVNAHLWDAALFFQLPKGFTTQAGTLFLANGLIFWILVKLLPGIEVDGFVPALIAPLVFTIASMIINEYGKDIDWIALGKMLLELARSVRDYFLTVVAKPDHSAVAPTKLFALLR